MFTLEVIQAAHAQFIGPDFPKLIQEFKKMGMETNTVDIESGLVSYATADEVLQTEGLKSRGTVANVANQTAAQVDLVYHQKGQTDFQTFCDEMAATGIYKWVIDLEKMTCTYYDKANQPVIAEVISGGE
ncbi:Phage envelope protein [Chlamydia trachomatis]|nr:Phage envelope protein [Chlamydia trachomatis]